jgi:stage II sporulation protein AA (anti-sigma F factor antagonist)
MNKGALNMQMASSVNGGVLYIKLIGEMDEYSSGEIRKQCDNLLVESGGVDEVIFNLSEVAFMDSTGIGFLIGRYKKALRLGIKTYVQKPNFAADKILQLSGIYSLIPKAD